MFDIVYQEHNGQKHWSEQMVDAADWYTNTAKLRWNMIFFLLFQNALDKLTNLVLGTEYLLHWNISRLH